MNYAIEEGHTHRNENPLQSFNELNLSIPLNRAITELGFEKPSLIQAQALPILLGEPTDFLGLAATGTGKTAAFAIPLIERIDPKIRAVQGLILCPTRELALQVAGQIDLLGKYKGVSALTVYGGTGYGDQIYGLKKGTPIVVGTPGRIVDHIEKGTLRLDSLTTIILDEADEMISMGFKDELETILGSVSGGGNQTWLFSATMNSDVAKVADRYLKNPQQVQINKTEVLPELLEQIYYATQESNKPEVLCKLIDAAESFYGIVFCQTKSLVTDLTLYLQGRGYKVDSLHGDKDQNAREHTMKSFRDRKVSLLICTDVASRGLDVKDITHVINYSIPRELDSYIHRIGRTARNGKAGFALSLVTPSHRGLIGRIERMTKSRMREGKIPTRKEIGGKKIAAALNRFMDQSSYARAFELMSEDWKKAISEMPREEISARFLAMQFPEVFSETPGTLCQKAAPSGAIISKVESKPAYEDRRQGGHQSWKERRAEGRREPRASRDFGNRRDSLPQPRPKEHYQVVTTPSLSRDPMIAAIMAQAKPKKKSFPTQKKNKSNWDKPLTRSVR